LSRHESQGLLAAPVERRRRHVARDVLARHDDLGRRCRLAASRRRIEPVSNATRRDNQLHTQQQSENCEAPGCTEPGGAFTSERDGQVYEFCSEACRVAFERPIG
jgi:hypothetical protein